MGEIFELNMEVLKKENPLLAQECERFYTEKYDELEQILCEKTKNNLINFKVNINGHFLFLHSSYDPVKEAKKWADRIDVKGIDTIVVLGVGVGYHLDELFYRFPSKNKIIIEPDFGVFVKLLTVRDIRHLLSAKNTFFIFSKDTEDIGKEFFGLRDEGQIDNVSFEELLSYRTAYGDWYNRLKKDFIKFSKLYTININTGVFFSNEWVENYFMNLIQIPESINLDSYEAKLKGVPAIIVSAGPSLNKNIHLLKELKDRALIISAGSAINILNNKGITPHIMVGVDGGQGESKIFNNVGDNNIYFAYNPTVHFDGLKNYKGPKLYFKTNVFGYSNWFEKEMGIDTKPIYSGASVSNLSIDIARLMGCDPIILVGQDMSYTNMQSYAEGAVLKEEQDKFVKKNIEEQNKLFIRETDINGDTVYTIPSMISIKIYFEEYVKFHPDKTFLNGTEGGLPIKGICNKPLKEIGEEYCGNKYDIEGIIGSIYRSKMSNADDMMYKITDFIRKVNRESDEMKGKALKRMDLILNILNGNKKNKNNKEWNEIDKLTDDLEEYDLYKFFIEPVCKQFVQAIKNERERKIELIENTEEKLKYLYEGLLMQYTDIKDKIVLVNEISKKILDEIRC